MLGGKEVKNTRLCTSSYTYIVHCNRTLAATVCMHVHTCILLFLEMSREEEVVKRARLLKVAHVQIIDMQAVTEH